jgi:tRNA A-37 threonylcarbamoyl transferase component Bud32
VKSTWVNNGSKALFRNFIITNKSPWITRLTDACNILSVDVVEGDAFLGRGAYGRVFRVMRDEKVLALKIVEECSIGRLYDEAEALNRAHLTGLTIRRVGECIEIPNGAALLLSPVGRSLSRPTTVDEVANVFRLLQRLHENDLVHGDPRVPNIIVYEEELLWIDLVEVRKSSPALRIRDTEILTRSILQIPPNISLDRELYELIREYGKSTSQEDLSHLITIVWQTLGRVM